MDCNKEEAYMAKALAENKMQNGDFGGAQKLLLEAQRLFSDIESLPQMLAVCDVHSSAEKKINGLENWYGILQVMHFSDDATIKKQVRKLSLLLHPDKNKFAGAEAAFKLVWEASRLLADKDKRSQYDIRHRIYSRIASNQFNAHSGLQAAPANNASDSIVSNGTFWTRCQHCGYRYKFLRKYVNALLHCSSCRRSYMAFDTGFNGVPPKSSTDQKEVRNQGPCNTSTNQSVESTKAQPGSVVGDMGKKGILKEKFNENYVGGESENTEVRKSKVDDRSMKNCDESSKHELQKPQPEVTEPETGTSNSVCDESVSRKDQPPSVNSNQNKRRKFVDVPTESSNVDGSDIIEDKEDSKLNDRRKTRQFSYAEEGSRDDPLCPLKKKPRSSVELKSDRTTEKINLGVGSSKRRDSGGSPVHYCAFKGEAKKNVDSEYQDISSTKDKESEGREVPESEGCEVPDPDFSNFELTTSCFAVNQVWSVYDPTDGMPRFYARIEKVLDSEFKLWITWIDPLQDNKDISIPIACGIFQDGDSDEVNDHLIFSSQMVHLHRNDNIVIYPRKGEIWALFRGWDNNWSTSSENHKRPYEYDYVEVLSDFDDEAGLGVAYLVKVEGFISLFRRNVQHGVLQLQISPSEMLRFSHKVPSFKMTGKEREGVPLGCFELDTAALSKDLFDVDGGLDSKRPNSKSSGPFPEASKVEMQAHTTLESSPSLKKRQKIHDNYNSFSKASDDRCASHERNSLKKSTKSVKAVDDLKLRKSPRFSVTNNQTTSRSGKQTSEKKSANDGESCGQLAGFCLSGEKNSSRIRKTLRDIDKPTGNSKKNGIHRLRRDNFWSVSPKPVDSWIWKTVLNLRSLAKKFLFCKIGNGKTANFWFDNWLGTGSLISVLGIDAPQRFGIPKLTTVAQVCTDTTRRIPQERSRIPGSRTLRALVATVAIPLPQDDIDTYFWSTDSTKQIAFSSKDTWEQVRHKAPEKQWVSSVWFSLAVPKHSFTFWTANLNRLPVRARLIRWGLDVSEACCICNQSIESREHIFLWCDFAIVLWLKLMQRLGEFPCVFDSWDVFMTWLQPVMASPKLLLRRLCTQALIFVIWKERNNRLHNGVSQPATVIFHQLDRMIRDILLARLATKGNHKILSLWGNSLLSQSSGGIKCSKPETHVPSSCKSRQENTCNFENQRSWDKFQIDQIWAIYSNDNGIPRMYAQIQKIETSPEFKLHVAPLEVYRPPNLMTRLLCCGCFKLKTGKAEVFVPSGFSHQVKAVKGKSNKFEIYPGKGEIWALYRNWNTTDCAQTEEFEIVEIVETDKQSIQVMLLTAKGFNKHLYEKSQQSKDSLVDIPKTEVCRFSHQIPSFRHERRVTRFGDSEYWELDPKAISCLNSNYP